MEPVQLGTATSHIFEHKNKMQTIKVIESIKTHTTLTEALHKIEEVNLPHNI